MYSFLLLNLGKEMMMMMFARKSQEI